MNNRDDRDSERSAERDDASGLDVRPQAEVVPTGEAVELLARAARIRERSQELVVALGADHPMVAEALERAAALEHQARKPGEIRLH